MNIPELRFPHRALFTAALLASFALAQDDTGSAVKAVSLAAHFDAAKMNDRLRPDPYTRPAPDPEGGGLMFAFYPWRKYGWWAGPTVDYTFYTGKVRYASDRGRTTWNALLGGMRWDMPSTGGGFLPGARFSFEMGSMTGPAVPWNRISQNSEYLMTRAGMGVMWGRRKLPNDLDMVLINEHPPTWGVIVTLHWNHTYKHYATAQIAIERTWNLR